MKKRHYILLMVALCAGYAVVKGCMADRVSADILETGLTIIATVYLFMELKGNEQINEAQLVMELNNQFITNPQFAEVELALEVYFDAYRRAGSPDNRENDIPLALELDKIDGERQKVVNYLVYLEGIATLVNEGVLHLKVISDLMAYRYFIAVNNPLIQEKELGPDREFYRGIIGIYDNWSKTLGEGKVPMENYSLGKWIKEEEQP